MKISSKQTGGIVNVNGKLLLELPTFENGENYTKKVVKRGYLNAEEENVFLMAVVLNQLFEGIRRFNNSKEVDGDIPVWEDWEKRGIITPAQRKNLKMANTYLDKFISSVFNDNLDKQTKDKEFKKLRKWDIRLIDDFTLKKIYSLVDKANELQIDKDELYDFIEAKMVQDCDGCTKNHQECEFFKTCEKYFIAPSEQDPELLKPNCPYAYDKYVKKENE